MLNNIFYPLSPYIIYCHHSKDSFTFKKIEDCLKINYGIRKEKNGGAEEGGSGPYRNGASLSAF